MKLSKLIRELSVAKDKIKSDPEVEIYTHLETEKEVARLMYLGKVISVRYINNPDNIRLIVE